ncbi:MAG TPA: PAS domain S-box protein [Solirubrobacteraceae bacterium]|nr:PAS domain S-box protein [Solirubrobacteraceae bacterium]
MQEHDSTELADWVLDAHGFLASILECVAQPVWVVDRDGLIVFANPASLATLGYDSVDELLGRQSHETIHYRYPDGRPFPARECPMLRPRTTGETVRSDEDWFFRKDGAMFPVSYVSAPIDTPSGRGAVVAFSDISDRRVVEEAVREREIAAARNAELQASELRLRAMLETAFDAIVSTDHRRRITYFNSAAQQTFGHLSEQVLGADLVSLIVPERLRDSHGAWWSARQREDREVLGRELEITALHADGHEFPVEFALTRMSLRGSTGYTAYYRDITERRRAERDLEQARRRVIEAADGERRRIARDLHDGAQQQLVNVAFNLELAGQQLGDDPVSAREGIELARQEARAAGAALRELVAGIHPAILTNRGLAAAVGSLAGRLPVHVELVDLHDGRLAQPVEAGAYFVICEALTNVVKHARASRVTVSAIVADAQLLVTVVDDGIGGARVGAGSGLTGLADRVAALDGALSVSSRDGHGTALSCRIPLVQRQGAADPLPAG